MAMPEVHFDETRKLFIPVQVQDMSMSEIQTIALAHGQKVILLPSITQLSAEHAGAIIITGSHGGPSIIPYAIRVPIIALFFNDAGVGKDQAGISALSALDDHQLPAAAYSHQSARIGDAHDGWNNGIISHVNAAAKRLGLAPSLTIRAAATALDLILFQQGA